MNKLLVLYDLNPENYTIWKKFGFEYLPSAVVINPTDTSCKIFSFENITKENIVITDSEGFVYGTFRVLTYKI